MTGGHIEILFYAKNLDGYLRGTDLFSSMLVEAITHHVLSSSNLTLLHRNKLTNLLKLARRACANVVHRPLGHPNFLLRSYLFIIINTQKYLNLHLNTFFKRK